MLAATRSDGVIIRAPAKINLFLEVLDRRSDGYHEIATLMLAVGLYDTLEFKEDPSGNIELTCDDPNLSTGAENLICRAAALLQQQTGTRRGARIYLSKRIPLAAGLAGGSSDAAATLVGLNELWQLGRDRSDLAALAAKIGSDVAFFVTAAAAWCTGRGEIVTPLPVGRALDLVLVCPAGGLSTAQVYGGVKVPDQPTRGDAIRQAVVRGDVEAIGRLLFNRLQESAELLCPDVARWQARLAAFAPAGIAMSGSGSTVYALCRNRREALRIIREIKAKGGPSLDFPKMFLVRSCV